MSTPAVKKPRKQPSQKARALAAAHAKLMAAQKALEEAEGELDDVNGVPKEGRPTKFKPEFTLRVTDLCMLGFTNEDLAAHFGTNLTQIERWIADVPEFRRAIWAGRDGADAKVARSMFKAATGYEHAEDDIRVVALGAGMGSEIVITPTVKHYAPSDRAAQMWLMNRQRARWAALNSGAQSASASEQAQAARAAIRAAMAETDPEEPSEDAPS